MSREPTTPFQPGLRAQVTQIWRLLDANGVKVPQKGARSPKKSHLRVVRGCLGRCGFDVDLMYIYIYIYIHVYIYDILYVSIYIYTHVLEVFLGLDEK